MKLGRNAILIVSINILISCSTKKLQSEFKESEIEKKSNLESEFVLKKTSKNQTIKLGLNLDSLLMNKFKFKSTDTSFIFAEVKNGEIQIIYVNKNSEETIERKQREIKKESTKEETEIKTIKEKESKKMPFIGLIGILIFIIGFLLFFGNRKNRD